MKSSMKLVKKSKLKVYSLHLTLLFSTIISCTPDAKPKLKIYGEIVVKELDLSSRVTSRVSKVHVTEGQKVKAGQVIIEFEDDIIKERQSRALSDLSAAKSQKEIADHAVRPEELRAAEAALSASKSQYAFAQSTKNRMEKLLAEGAISRQQYEEVEFKFVASKAKLNADEAQLEMAQKGARDESKSQANVLVEKALSGVNEANAYSKDLTITAPIEAEVSTILAESGELVPQGFGVVTLLNMNNMWSSFYVPETLLGKLPMGKSVAIWVEALQKSFPGKISYIAPMASYATKTHTEDKSSFDVKTFEIRVRLDQSSDWIRPGMSCELREPSLQK